MNRGIAAGAALFSILVAGIAEAGGVAGVQSKGHARRVGSNQLDPRQPWATSVPTPSNPALNLQGSQTWATDPKTVFGSQDGGVAPIPPRNAPFDDRFRNRPFKSGTVIVAPAPLYVVPSQCYVPGYWNYQWIPQAYSYSEWVPGQWAPDGSWIDGHYEARLAMSGFWQPYWVDAQSC